MSKCYESIIDPKSVRPEPEYFRVAYYGRGFPGFLQNKIFVHRGDGYERLSDFQNRMLGQFPNAELLTKLTPPERAKQESAEQFMQINKVECIPDHSNDVISRPGVTESIRKFYCSNNVSRFTYSRPFHQGERDKDNEFATLCVEKTTLTTSKALPGILRCFPVVGQSTLLLTPLLNAIETMRQTNSELKVLVQSHSLKPDLALNSLTMKLSGMIDAAVMGGVANYEKAFLKPEYIEAHPEEADEIEDLKTLIRDMVPILELGLMVHAEKVSEQIIELHKHMLKTFTDMKATVIKKYGSAPYPDLKVKIRSLQAGRQNSFDGSSRGSSGAQLFASEIVCTGYSSNTLPPRNTNSTASLPPRKKESKFRTLIRRESSCGPSNMSSNLNSTTKDSLQPQSLFYDHHLSSSSAHEPILELQEPTTSVSSRPSSMLSVSSVTSATASYDSLCERPSSAGASEDGASVNGTVLSSSSGASSGGLVLGSAGSGSGSSGAGSGSGSSQGKRTPTVSGEYTVNGDDVPPPLPIKTRVHVSLIF